MHSYVLWICLFAYVIYIFEEKILEWRSWAEKNLGLKDLEWSDFYIANTVVLVTGVSCAMVGWQAPSFALMIASYQIINALFFHIVPTVLQRSFSPGVISSVLLLLPIGFWAYISADKDNVLTQETIVLSIIFGTLLMASPFILFRVKSILGITKKKEKKEPTGPKAKKKSPRT